MAKWPSNPYKGLAFYGPEDRLLFAGREADVEVCAGLLAAPNTRILLLHGKTGCGKSSLLRAGLIPTVEARAYGFEFLRREVNGVRLPVFVRSTAAPLARLGEELFRFVSKKHQARTATGEVEIDLSAAALNCQTVGRFIEAVRAPHEMVLSLSKISEKLPNTLVIVLDQAEEVLTLTQPADVDRIHFFQCLKLLSASYLDVKLVITLRTEYFGMFFDLMGIDASVKTDVNQFHLKELDKSSVAEAILRPTSKENRSASTSAFDEYQFEYDQSLVDLILYDLFRTTQSGGILPAMQTVCRDLYNEIKKQEKPWVIDRRLYVGGGGVTGRVDHHITVSLQEAIDLSIADTRAHMEYPWSLPSISLADEERKWRQALLSLVKLDSDGTARTDLVDVNTIVQGLGTARPSYDYLKLIEIIAKPEVLIIRDFVIFNPKTGINETKYSLGHDAIALALHRWTVEETQAIQKRVAQRRARVRLGFLVASCIAGVVGTATVAVKSIQDTSELAQALISSAQRRYVDNPNTAITAAIQANSVLEGNVGTYFLNRASSKQALVEMIAELPTKRIFPKDLGFNSKAATLIAVPSVGQFVVCCSDRKIHVVDPSTSVPIYQHSFDIDGSNAEPRLVAAADAGDGTYVLFLANSLDPDSSDERGTLPERVAEEDRLRQLVRAQAIYEELLRTTLGTLSFARDA
jgi:hypothetical protein